MKKAKLSLAWQILIGLVLGIAIGAVLNHFSAEKAWWISNVLQPAGDIFIRLIKMIVIPIVISSLIVGIAGVGDAKKLGRIGVKTILYFEIVTTIAIVVGLLLANVFHPGAGIDMSTLGTVDISKYQATAAEVQHEHAFVQTILNLIPSNIFAAVARGEMLPIIFFSVLFGLGLSSLKPELREPLVTMFQGVSESMFKVTHMIMKYAPIGVFALIAVTVANFGFASLLPLAKLVILVYVAILFFAFVVLGLIARLFGFSVIKLMRIFKDELVLAYSTASSETVLPRVIEKMEAYGAPKAICSFVVPTGYSFNLDGSTLYQSIAAIFIAQLYGIDLSVGQQLMLVLTLMVTSKGIAGVPGVSFVVLLATLGSVGIPLEGLAFIAGVDRVMDMARTALNVIGNALAVLVISRWEGMYDDAKGERYWNSLPHWRTKQVLPVGETSRG
ncbi:MULTISPECIES: glutamate/aspartate:proton symporter GltP [Pseudomonas]|jgi:proton glutamate symport protein|uniref:Probable proton/glutamate-aspartate symporter n=2 Tax=Pseudomonas veronii TaxID=76761 RepID=A0A4P7Y317_PSEVE|nr:MULTISPECIES: glutamate/aspartate:proton symporter GltP [Pseudomonas]MBJ2179405.1 glutamate/aspartate:proton symporter GltP [Pseudomonas veronii]MCI1740555.1 glutamate/aspartate:proton symporter GltP [Pseudomonas veronii]MDF3242647.1 glutamate/aspartate:proton symporter GltP [Pseudomonas veronii]MDY7550479.1 glutamate/aspartate:proton symporter GltP [Pseudomonas sp. FG1]MEB0053059.1 glutamate/aspartate:proton symporter GltP [Pseudomonas sp. FG1]